jgi:hypothetical protein
VAHPLPPECGGCELFLHRNDRLASAFTWVVPVRFLVSKSTIELTRIDAGVGDNPGTTCSRNELFGGSNHLAAYSSPLETWLYGDLYNRSAPVSSSRKSIRSVPNSSSSCQKPMK